VVEQWRRAADADAQHALHQAAEAAALGGGDPGPALADLVAKADFHVAPTGECYVYGYELCREMLRTPLLYKGGQHVSSVPAHLSQEQRQVLAAAAPPDPGMLTSLDDPDHARLRRFVSRAFAPNSVRHYRASTRQAMERALSRLRRDEPVDLVAGLCEQVPSQVIGELIGVPLPDRDRFLAMAKIQAVGRNPGATFEEHLAALRARTQMFEYVAAMIERERAHPDPSTPLGTLIVLEREEGRITTEELISLVALMYSAGFGTTQRLLGNALVLLMQHPDQAAALRADPALARQATEECGRVGAPVMDVGYWVGPGTTVGGQQLEAGKRCTMVLGAANRDPYAFDDPLVFDIGRTRRNLPLSFGSGIHYCLGVALTKVEVDVVLPEMMTRFPRMALVEEPELARSFRSREHVRIPVVLEP
jgi:cytochrome P450